jgi:hypothetical protein
VVIDQRGASGCTKTYGFSIVCLVSACAVLIPVSVLFGEAIVNAWLPIYKAVFVWVADEFKLLQLFIDKEGVDRVIRAQVSWQPMVMYSGKAILTNSNGVANTSTLLAHALLGPMVAILIAFAWPLATKPNGGVVKPALRQWVARLMLLIPAVSICVLIDIPFVLVGELWALALPSLDPQAVSPLIIWKQFLQNGGRYALNAVAGIFAVVGAQRLAI